MFRFVLLASLVACAIGSAIPASPRFAVPRLDGRIVGGVDTTIEQFPWQASLRFWGSHHCGATIISADTVLTAAHCVYGLTGSNLAINAGSTSRVVVGQLIDVARFVLHPQYDDNTLNNDIAVLKLASPLQWTDGVQPIALPAAGTELDEGVLVTVTGWGALWENGPAPTILQKVTVPVVERSRCDSALRWDVTENMFCAGFEEGGLDACGGDSGGPVVTNNELVGLVSWGDGCARPGLPGVYTQVSNYISWIHAQ